MPVLRDTQEDLIHKTTLTTKICDIMCINGCNHMCHALCRVPKILVIKVLPVSVIIQELTLNATKVVCFSRPLKCFRSLYGKQCRPRSDCSGFTLFASLLNSSVMLGNYLQQTTSADNFFRCIFFFGALRVNRERPFLPPLPM